VLRENRAKLHALRGDFKASAAIDVDLGLPEVESLILPLCAEGSDLVPQGRKKKLGLKRLIRRVRDDGEEFEIEDHHFCEYKYKQFYKDIQQQKVLFFILFICINHALLIMNGRRFFVHK
jgi:hypothetical protein